MDNYSTNIKPRLSFEDAVSAVLKKYAVFTGRSRRSEFWWYVLAYNIVLAIFYVFQWVMMGISFSAGHPFAYLDSPIYWGLVVVSCVFYFATLLPSLAVTVRRLHDIGKSGWNILIFIIPIVGWILLIVWLCQDSDAVTNKYGESPKYKNSAYSTYYSQNNKVRYEDSSSSLSTLVWIMAFVIAVLIVVLIFALNRGGSSTTTNQNPTNIFAQQPMEEDSIEEIVDSVIDYLGPVEETVSWDVVNNAYVQVLNNISNEVDDCSYFLYDITGDGTPELWIKAGSCEADYMLYVCTYDNGVQKIFETGAGHSGFYSTSNGIIQMCAHMGYSTWYRISYNGKINITEIFNEDINGTDNDYREPSGRYIELQSL